MGQSLMTQLIKLQDNNKSYNDIPSLEDVVKVKKDRNSMTPSKEVFDVTLSDTGSSNDTEPDNQDSPTKLDFTDAYDNVDIHRDPNGG